MRRELHFAEQPPGRGIDRRQRTVAESDIQPLGRSVIPHIVGIVAKPYDDARSVVVRTEQLQAFTLAVGDGYSPRVSGDGDSLRLPESWQASGVSADPDIQNFNRVVAKRRYIEPLHRSVV